jgi:cytidylate kinase
MSYRTICVSRDAGAAGEEIGQAVATSLGFRYVDEDIVRAAADRTGVDLETAMSAEQRRTLAHKLLDLLAQNGGALGSYAFAPELHHSGVTTDSGQQIPEVIREVVRETADAGEAVIVAHAASHVLAGRPEVLRTLVTASPQVRAKRLGELPGVGDGEAAVREADKARADYLQRFHEVKRELPTHYDLVLNTDMLSIGAAAAVIADAATR